MSSLVGRRVMLTRPASQAQGMAANLAALQAVPILLPVIEIAPLADTSELDNALFALAAYDWLILTSVNGVGAVWDRLAELKVPGLPPALKVAAIGPKTAHGLEQRGIQPDFVPSEYVAEAIYPGLGNVNGKQILLARADIARPALLRLIEQGGGRAVDIAAYRTLPAQADPTGLAELRRGVDVIAFTSPSTVHNFVRLCNGEQLRFPDLPGKPVFAVIGPITAQALADYGVKPDLVAVEYTAEGLVAALLNYFESQPLRNSL